jgi:hypothetical protein
METINGLNKQSTRVILSTAFILVLWSLGSSITAAGPWSASVITFLLYTFYWFYAVKFKNQLILRLAIIGTIAGFMELIADYYLVSVINSLVYPAKEAMIWDSPAYMPFAWSNIILQLSFIGVLLAQKFNVLKASIILCIAGGMYIPLYEHLANNAGWWFYHPNTLMVFNAPVYIIISEALISLSLPMLIRLSEHNKIGKSIGLGILEGFWIVVSAMLGWKLVLIM